MTDTETGSGDERKSTRSGPAVPVSRRRLLASMTATALGGSAFTGRALAGSSGSTGDADEFQGVERVQEEAWVETGVDTNDTGTNDRIYVRASRPASTDDGEPLPVIATASPYYGEQTHGDTTPEMLYDRKIELSASSGGGESATGDVGQRAVAGGARRGQGEASTGGTGPSHRRSLGGGLTDALALEQRYLPEGYVVAKVSSLGTHRSTGCYTAAGPPTVEALASVVDWFNGRATAYDARTGGNTVEADWTNGKTGMIGTSANGELANGVATTGVDDLEAVVPQSANNGQYSLFRSNGTPISVTKDGSGRIADLSSWVEAGNAKRPSCGHWAERIADGQDHATGDYSDFWHEREFLPHADSVEAGVLLTHTVDDPIVKPNNFADWYEMLAGEDVPLKLWLHKGGHTSPRSQAFRDLLDRWWAYWLKDVDNGVMDEDPVSVVHGGRSADDGTLDTYAAWPVPDAERATVGFTAGGRSAGAVAVNESGSAEESFVDDPSTSATELVAAAESDHRLRYRTPPLAKSVHVSGKVVPNLSLSFDDPTVVSVALVEYGPGGADVVTRGWADPLNRPSYSEYDSPVAYKQSLRASSPLDANERVQVEFPLQAADHVFESGSRIGLVVYASDRKFTPHPPGNATVTLSLADSSVAVPVVGGGAALAGAFGDESAGTRTAAGTTESAESTDGSGPGFGLGSAAAALGGAGYLLKRRATDEE